MGVGVGVRELVRVGTAHCRPVPSLVAHSHWPHCTPFHPAKRTHCAYSTLVLAGLGSVDTPAILNVISDVQGTLSAIDFSSISGKLDDFKVPAHPQCSCCCCCSCVEGGGGGGDCLSSAVRTARSGLTVHRGVLRASPVASVGVGTALCCVYVWL
jgi:hypothetical protein